MPNKTQQKRDNDREIGQLTTQLFCVNIRTDTCDVHHPVVLSLGLIDALPMDLHFRCVGSAMIFDI